MSMSVLEDMRRGGASKYDEPEREEIVSGVVGDGRKEASGQTVEVDAVEVWMSGGHENREECVLRGSVSTRSTVRNTGTRGIDEYNEK